MNITEYKEIIEKTAVYPKHIGLAYCMLGLNGEFGEFIHELRIKESLENMVAENGDVYWYLVALCYELQRPNLFEDSIALAKSYVSNKKIDSISSYIEQFYTLNSKLSEMIKKHYRDSSQLLPELIDVVLGSLIMNVYVITHVSQLDFDHVLETNYKKLILRKEQRLNNISTSS